MKEYKWHYFNSKDSVCVFENPFNKETVRRTYCGKDPLKLKFCTPVRRSVTCLVCLSQISQKDYEKGIFEDN